ncbi:MAG: CRISPR-associated endonuclease Cas3'' [Bacteroidia bacterium]|nr:CRISPR-associated endonuclease Cas3'' [Bacteroidia bacterium]
MKILAKSEPQLTLQEHVDDCLLIWENLRVCFCQVKDLQPLLGSLDFWTFLRQCVIFHDLGKAHSEFQKLLQNQPNAWNRQRHELFSLPFIEAFNIDEDLRKLMRLVIAGHHKNFDTLYHQFIRPYYRSPTSNPLDFEEEEKLVFAEEFKKVDQPGIVALLNSAYGISLSSLGKVTSPEKTIGSYLNKATTGRITVGEANYFQLLLLFGALKHCDHLGSARIPMIETIESKRF